MPGRASGSWRAGVEHGADIFERAAPLWPAVAAAAAADPDVERYWRGVAANRRAGQARIVARLAEFGALHKGLDPAVPPTSSSYCSATTCSAAWSAGPAGTSTPTRRRSSAPRRAAAAATEARSTKPSLTSPTATCSANRSAHPIGQSAPIWSRIVLRTQRPYWSSDQPRSMTRFLNVPTLAKRPAGVSANMPMPMSGGNARSRLSRRPRASSSL